MRREIDIRQDGPAKILGGMDALAIKQDAELISICCGEDDEAAALCREVNA